MVRKTSAEKREEALRQETALNTNREGTLVRPGQIWQDLNPRSEGRMISVSSVSAGVATSFDGKRSRAVAVTRLYPHSRGYTIIGSP